VDDPHNEPERILPRPDRSLTALDQRFGGVRPRGRRQAVLGGLALLLATLPTWALGPHEVLLIVNARSASSVALAETYAALRGIPDANLVHVDVPPELVKADAMSPRQFTTHIWDPANGVARERGIDGHILAWVYSSDFPVRITTKPALSLTGLTFVRNQLPDPKIVESGTYASPLFGGPEGERRRPHQPQTLDTFAEWLGREMPLPAMMLGYTQGKHGNTTEEVRACLQRGAASDGTAPTGGIWYVQSDDVRSVCRAWQQAPAVALLETLGVHAQVVREPVPALRDVLGMQVGAAVVKPDRHTYVSGAMAEHLTSVGADFNQNYQTTITAWIRAGATATAGTVTEPYALWPKFPNAHFFYNYASGCTMIESFAQAVRCPLQLLLLGEPLAAPFKPRDHLRVDGLGDGPLAEPCTIEPHVDSASGVDYRRFKYYVDGREVYTGRAYAFDPASFPAGPHRLRVVGYRSGLIRHQVFREWPFDRKANGGG
jgi:hypothetical protein